MQTLPTLTESEATLLSVLEHTIDAGKLTFLEVGSALSEIKEKELYRGAYDSFEAYCLKRHGFKTSYANNIIRAADTVRVLPPEIATIVATESQARELARIEPSKRVEVLQSVKATADAENRSVTAKDIRDQISPPNPSGGGEVAPTPSAALSFKAYALEMRAVIDRAYAALGDEEFNKFTCNNDVESRRCKDLNNGRKAKALNQMKEAA